MVDYWRTLAVLDVVVLFSSGYYLHVVFGPLLPKLLTRANYAFAGVLVLVGASVVANALSGTPPTVGVKIFAVGAGLAALFVLGLAVSVIRGRH